MPDGEEMFKVHGYSGSCQKPPLPRDNGMKWFKLTDRLPPYDDSLRVLIYTAEHDFNGEQFFDVRATDLYSRPDDDPRSEVCDFATHWSERPCLSL